MARAIEVGDAAARGIGVAVVQVDEKNLAGVIVHNLENDCGQDAAARRAVRRIVRGGLGGSIRRNRECLWAEVGATKRGRLGAGRLRRDAGGRDQVPVNACLNREVIEGDVLRRVAVGEGPEVHSVGPHGAAVVVEAGLPADEVLDVLHHKLNGVRVGSGVRRGACQAKIDRADGHRVRKVVIRIACRVHVEGDCDVRVRLRAGEAGGKEEAR